MTPLKGRFYTLLLALIPRKQQRKLATYLMDRTGYSGKIFLGGHWYWVVGTKNEKNDIFGALKKLNETPSS